MTWNSPGLSETLISRTLANCRHGLPIDRIIAFLHTLKLETCIPPHIIGKIPQALTGIAQKDNRLARVHDSICVSIDICKHGALP